MSILATKETWALDIKGLTSSQKLFLLACAERASPLGLCFPSIERLSKDTRLNKKTIVSIRKSLIECGLISYTGKKYGKLKRIQEIKLMYLSNNINQPDIGLIIDANRPNIGSINQPDIGSINRPNIGLNNHKEEPKTITTTTTTTGVTDISKGEKINDNGGSGVFLKNSNFDSIDFSELENIGFKKQHLEQLSMVKDISPDELQRSIDYFSFDLRYNAKAKSIRTDPLTYFISIIKRSSKYTPNFNFKSKKEMDMERYSEERKRRLESLKCVLWGEYVSVRNNLIKKEYDALKKTEREELIKKFSQSSDMMGSNVIANWFKQYGIDNIQVWNSFCDWASELSSEWLKNIKKFDFFCEEKGLLDKQMTE